MNFLWSFNSKGKREEGLAGHLWTKSIDSEGFWGSKLPLFWKNYQHFPQKIITRTSKTSRKKKAQHSKSAQKKKNVHNTKIYEAIKRIDHLLNFYFSSKFIIVVMPPKLDWKIVKKGGRSSMNKKRNLIAPNSFYDVSLFMEVSTSNFCFYSPFLMIFNH